VRIVPVLIAGVLAFATTGVLSVVHLVVRDILQVESEADGCDPDQEA
jgi:hypothetical protein